LYLIESTVAVWELYDFSSKEEFNSDFIESIAFDTANRIDTGIEGYKQPASY
jgi:hypothetical protein